MLSRRAICGACVLAVAAMIAIQHGGASAATTILPKPVLQAKLAGKTGQGNAVIAVSPDGKKGLRVDVIGLKPLSGKTLGVGFFRGTTSVPVGTIKINADGGGTLLTGMFPEAKPGDVCKVLGDLKVVVLEGTFQTPK